MGGIGGLLAVLFAALVAIMLTMRFVRRWVHRRATPPPPAFDQAELRAMLASGQISATEFQRLRSLVLAQQSAAATAADAPRGPRGFEPLPLPVEPAPDAGNPPAGR
jgi:hypothetical protein